jgi:hypothetical protein
VSASVRTAAVASIPGALVAHLLDLSGRLPFVHETAGVRGAMGPGTVVVWLAVTAMLAGLAASSRRPAILGAPAALASAGLPEMIGRHDIGAVLEPGAILGALLQWLLLLLVVGLALLARSVLRREPMLAWTPSPSLALSQPYRGRFSSQPLHWRRRPRGPPCPTFP